MLIRIWLGQGFASGGLGTLITELKAKYCAECVEDYSMNITEAERRSASGLWTSCVDVHQRQNWKNFTPTNSFDQNLHIELNLDKVNNC